jgi:large subunit ribosomal protein L6
MSRKGKDPIALPKGIEVKTVGDIIHVKGSRGSLEQKLMPGIKIDIVDNHCVVSLDEEHKGEGKIHGLYRSLIHNMVVGVHTGYEIKLEMIGLGYRAALQGHKLDLQIGLSHPTQIPIPHGITVTVEKNTQISVKGNNKQQVGQFAATVRGMKPPEPYLGKGIRYVGEHVRKKDWKGAAKK